VPAGELGRQPVGELGQVDQRQQLVDLGGYLPLGTLLDLETEADVVGHAHVPERRVVLEHEPDVPLLGRQPGRVVALDLDGALIRQLEPRDDPQQRRLATAAGAEQRGQLTGRDLQVDVGERDEVAEALADATNVDAHCSSLLIGGSPPWDAGWSRPPGR
jgi:hypothetical protein